MIKLSKGCKWRRMNKKKSIRGISSKVDRKMKRSKRKKKRRRKKIELIKEGIV
jgi:hypothetical protein